MPAMPAEPSGRAELTLDTAVRVQLDGQPRDVRVANLIEGCPDHRPFAGDTTTRDKYASCGLLRVTEVEVGRRWVGRPRIIGTVLGVLVALTLVGLVIGYVDACADPDDGC